MLRRTLFHRLAGAGAVAISDLKASTKAPEGRGPDPLIEKPAPITMAQLAGRKTIGVAAVEVSDYRAAGFQGDLRPSPPHADLNPGKAILLVWGRTPHRFVFSHEASYCPWLELPNGVGLCNQFFEGNNGYGELFNDNGRKTRNSFVDVIQAGLERAWVRWNYFSVHKDDDSRPVLRGTEDYVSHPNGLVWRRLTYETMQPDKPEGYSWQPIDFFALAPKGTTWADLFPRDPRHGDYHIASVLDAYSDRQYDVYWDDAGKPRRNGDAELLWSISQSKGLAMVMPFRAGHLFTVLGDAAGFPSSKSQVVDHSFKDTGGWGWGAIRWDHWPVGWLNSQANDYKLGSPYPYHFGPLSHYIVSRRIVTAKNDFPVVTADMEHNRWSELHVYHTLMGVGRDMPSIRRLARRWLDKGTACAGAESAADL